MIPTCRFCSAPLEVTFADLGMSPLANRFLTLEDAARMEPFYPLHALVCAQCFLVQLEEFETPESIFGDYAYFSSYSTTWVTHAERYAEEMVDRWRLDTTSRVVELASNDGYLLQFFHQRSIPVLGIEPAANVARVAVQKGINTLVQFFGTEAARTLAPDHRADLLVGNNVLAHVPDINDFVAGMKILLSEGGVITMEFPHLLRLIERSQWDTIYHEHFSYLSFATARRIFAAHGLDLFDVEELQTHGGSLRIFARHRDDGSKLRTDRVDELLARERAAGLERLDSYTEYRLRVEQDKRNILHALIELKNGGKSVVGYGAPAKGNTFLNYCGIGRDVVDFTCDASPHKQGLLLPGTHIPIRPPGAIAEARPDVVLILPWNLKDEIVDELAYIRDWGGRFLVRLPIPRLLE